MYAEKYPEHVSSLILEAPFCAGLPIDNAKKPKRNFISDAEKNRIQEIRNRTDLSKAEKIVYAHMCGDWKRQHLTRPSYEEFCRIPHDCSFNEAFLEQTNMHVDALVNETKPDRVFKNDHNIPVTILWGNYDWTMPGTPEGLQRCFKDSQVVIFERANHSLHEDMPGLFVDVIRDATNSNGLNLDVQQNTVHDNSQREKKTSERKTAATLKKTPHRVEKSMTHKTKQRTLNLN